MLHVFFSQITCDQYVYGFSVLVSLSHSSCICFGLGSVYECFI